MRTLIFIIALLIALLMLLIIAWLLLVMAYTHKRSRPEYEPTKDEWKGINDL